MRSEGWSLRSSGSRPACADSRVLAGAMCVPSKGTPLAEELRGLGDARRDRSAQDPCGTPSQAYVVYRTRSSAAKVSAIANPRAFGTRSCADGRRAAQPAELGGTSSLRSTAALTRSRAREPGWATATRARSPRCNRCCRAAARSPFLVSGFGHTSTRPADRDRRGADRGIRLRARRADDLGQCPGACRTNAPVFVFPVGVAQPIASMLYLVASIAVSSAVMIVA